VIARWIPAHDRIDANGTLIFSSGHGFEIMSSKANIELRSHIIWWKCYTSREGLGQVALPPGASVHSALVKTADDHEGLRCHITGTRRQKESDRTSDFNGLPRRAIGIRLTRSARIASSPGRVANGVSNCPGATTLTRTPKGPSRQPSAGTSLRAHPLLFRYKPPPA
jgi:hypothetical protein